jgi:hypothetical protein
MAGLDHVGGIVNNLVSLTDQWSHNVAGLFKQVFLLGLDYFMVLRGNLLPDERLCEWLLKLM